MAKRNSSINNNKNKNLKGSNTNRDKSKKLENTVRIRVDRDKNKKLENTTRIRVDRERLNDSDSLDTSFLEGRLRENSKVKEKVLKDKRTMPIDFGMMKRIFFILGLLCVVVLSILVFVSYLEHPKKSVPKTKEGVKKVPKKEKVLDDNYLFVGDFYTDAFDFEEFELDYHYVKVSDSGYTTEDVLGHMKEYIYDYNPSILFIELGVNDLKDNRDMDDIIDSLEKIIDNVQTNRPYASIYIESLYPINDTIEDFDDDSLDGVTNKEINKLNKKIVELTKKKEVHYINLYDELIENDKLKEDYTDNGIDLNKDGYKRVFKIIRGIVDDEHENS